MQTKEGADSRYKPKFNVVHSEVARHLTIHAQRHTMTKSPI